MQNKPNLLNTQMNVSEDSTRAYENETAFGLRKNKPNQTQFEAQSNPIRSQYKPNQTQFQTQFQTGPPTPFFKNPGNFSFQFFKPA